MIRAPITRPARNVLSRRVARSFVERTRPRYAASARRVVTFVSEASGENRWRIGLTARWPPARWIGTMSIRRYREWTACGLEANPRRPNEPPGLPFAGV
jgi:hypothetical protein